MDLGDEFLWFAAGSGNADDSGRRGAVLVEGQTTNTIKQPARRLPAGQTVWPMVLAAAVVLVAEQTALPADLADAAAADLVAAAAWAAWGTTPGLRTFSFTI